MSEVETSDPAADDHPAAAEPPPLSESDAALQRYQHRLGRQRLVYFSAIAVVLAVIGVLVGVAWVHGEVHNTTLHTVHPPPQALPVAAASPNPQQAWQTSDRIAIGPPRWQGTIVTYSAHTVRGRDARTGAETWSYNRSDRTVCTAIQTNGTTIAVYNHNGNCDELTAVNSETGERRWTRTLDKDGRPVNGQPAYQVSDATVVFSTTSVIYAIDPVTGFDRWEYSRGGCAIQHVVQGDSGVLISQDCHHVDCGSQQFCGNGPQLLMRDGSAGRNDDDDVNPDRLRWNHIGDTDIPVCADQLIAAVNTTTHALDMLDSATGGARGSLTLDPAPAAIEPSLATDTVSTEVIWMGGVTYAVNATSRELTWAVRTSGPTTVETDTEGVTASIETARITVPGPPGIDILDGNDGHTAQRFALPVPRTSLVYSLGTGFLVSTDSGTIAYR